MTRAPRKPRQSPTYRVRWEIDIEAGSVLDAVRQARRLQVGPHTTAKVFDAWPRDAPSKTKRIDICARSMDEVEPADVLLSIIEAFPGLVDGDSDVNGADLVQFLTERLRAMAHLEDFLPEGRAARKES